MATAFVNFKSFREETEIFINNYFDRIIDEVNERRFCVLTNFRDILESSAKIMRSIEQLEDTKIVVEAKMTDNTLHGDKDDLIQDLDKRIRDRKYEKYRVEDVDYQFVFDDKELKKVLSTLGVFEKSPKHYMSKSFMQHCFEIPIESGKVGKFSVDEETQIIVINHPNEKVIMYFNICELTLLNSFSLESYPTICEIEVINYEEILVSILDSKSILRIQFNPREQNEAKFVSQTNELFENIISLSYDKQCDQIYALSSVKNSIYIFERNLTLLITVKIKFAFSQSLFVGEERIYILKSDSPCIQVLSKSNNEMVNSIQCKRPDADKPTSFFVDRNENIILTLKNLIEIYSPSGHLLHSITLNQDPNTIIQPISVFVTLNYDIIVLSDASNRGLLSII